MIYELQSSIITNVIAKSAFKKLAINKSPTLNRAWSFCELEMTRMTFLGRMGWTREKRDARTPKGNWLHSIVELFWIIIYFRMKFRNSLTDFFISCFLIRAISNNKLHKETIFLFIMDMKRFRFTKFPNTPNSVRRRPSYLITCWWISNIPFHWTNGVLTIPEQIICYICRKHFSIMRSI